MSNMHFGLKRPCANCPFRTDIRPFLTPARAAEICNAMLADESFWCHKTIDYDGESDGATTKKTQHCAGALILLERLDRPNQLMRIAERLGVYDRTQLDMAAPVFESPDAFVHACGHPEDLPFRGASDLDRDNEQR